MPEVRCVSCEIRACVDEVSKTPSFCPRRVSEQALEKAEEIRTTDSEVMRTAEIAKAIETEGYRKWPRVRELIEFLKRSGMDKIGIAFCVVHHIFEFLGGLFEVLPSPEGQKPIRL